MNASRRIALALIAAPLSLGLAACNGDAEGGEVAEGEALDPIAAPEGQQWTDLVQATDEEGYLLGNPDAPIKLIEYGSFTCGACASFVQNGVDELKEDYVNTGLVSFELRNFDRNGIDTTISSIVRCGPDEIFHPLADQVWTNFDTVMTGVQSAQLEGVENLPENQRWVAVASETGLLDFFASRGISRNQAATCLADADAVQGLSERTNTTADELGVTGTPTFFVNGNRVDGTTWDVLEPVLQRAGARSE
ncbi:thioredoxin domain-containing protein [Aurantiacibacter aquimixticola]|uniref:Protein-disulfide isomerase n=1 Tax=Aurantiacibacter aquimixticola TaxID=1958945 RepID=A0A419RQJ7_9SPHN|nr:thioredoxin domain-containing protein [Aurantiacibacter aquimixticola]RJY08035.1 protein-disulfide isomerase [Aurantiacibacter aquimixticola]